MKSKQSALQRINRVVKFYMGRGVNKERVNKVLRNVLKKRYELHT
jgi:hypothetical protein